MKVLYELYDEEFKDIYVEVETNARDIICHIDFTATPYPICYFMKDGKILEPSKVIGLFKGKNSPSHVHSFKEHLYTMFFGDNWKGNMTVAMPSILKERLV